MESPASSGPKPVRTREYYGVGRHTLSVILRGIRGDQVDGSVVAHPPFRYSHVTLSGISRDITTPGFVCRWDGLSGRGDGRLTRPAQSPAGLGSSARERGPRPRQTRDLGHAHSAARHIRYTFCAVCRAIRYQRPPRKLTFRGAQLLTADATFRTTAGRSRRLRTGARSPLAPSVHTFRALFDSSGACPARSGEIQCGSMCARPMSVLPVSF